VTSGVCGLQKPQLVWADEGHRGAQESACCSGAETLSGAQLAIAAAPPLAESHFTRSAGLRQCSRLLNNHTKTQVGACLLAVVFLHLTVREPTTLELPYSLPCVRRPAAKLQVARHTTLSMYVPPASLGAALPFTHTPAPHISPLVLLCTELACLLGNQTRAF
jgi:hypothetical protein